ncbi:MAG TPA: M48 family metalloprotease, partial [Vicinamibacterales bacterium]
MNEDRASRYHRLRRRAAVASTVANAAWLLLLILSGAAVSLARWAEEHGARFTPTVGRTLSISLFVLIVALGHELIALPFSLYRSFVLDRRYGLSTEPIRTWLGDHLKAAALGLIVTLGAAIAISASMHLTRTWWWALCVLIFTLVGMLVTIVTPILLMPLFYRFRPLERVLLRDRLLTLSRRAGIAALGAFEWGLGEKTTRANAALVGLGRTRRILVSDTLLKDYSDDEIEVILAHEIGHHVNRDIWSALAIETGALTAALLAAHVVLLRFGAALGVHDSRELASLPMIALTAGAVSMLLAPIGNAWSRSHERRADQFALALTGQPSAFISAMRRLGAQNLAEDRPSLPAFWFFHTHPTIDER